MTYNANMERADTLCNPSKFRNTNYRYKRTVSTSFVTIGSNTSSNCYYLSQQPLPGVMEHTRQSTLFLMVLATSSIIQAVPVPGITARPAYCPGVTANNKSYIDELAASALRMGSLILPINVAYQNRSTAVGNVLTTHTESSFTECLGHPTPVPSANFPPANSPPAICNTAYQCDYDAGRLPQYITHVVCKSKFKTVNYSKNGQKGACECRPIYRPLTVLRFVGCDPYEQWRMEEQAVSVGCSCLHIQ